jgi:hypothetical protein
MKTLEQLVVLGCLIGQLILIGGGLSIVVQDGAAAPSAAVLFFAIGVVEAVIVARVLRRGTRP